MIIEHNKSLAGLNTLGFQQKAEFFCEPSTEEEMQESLSFANDKSLPIFILGAGSNIVLVSDIPGLTIRPNNTQVTYMRGENTTLVTADAGLNWHQFVLDTIDKGLNGLENLSLIPGNIGAAPIQNIGAYGAELGDALVEISAIELHSGKEILLSKDECRLGYRDSIFKHQLRGSVAIMKVKVALHNEPKPNYSYQALADALESKQITQPTAKDISKAVCSIRRSKLPDPDVIGNVGSFFKNPVIADEKLKLLRKEWPNLPAHSTPTSGHEPKYKIPAAWLIDAIGWRGHRSGHVGVHQDQALVLVNHGGGDGAELIRLSHKIAQSVSTTFGINLEQEPSTVDHTSW